MYCVDSSSLRLTGKQKDKVWEYLKLEVTSSSSELTIVPFLLQKTFDGLSQSGVTAQLKMPFPQGINVLSSK